MGIFVHSPDGLSYCSLIEVVLVAEKVSMICRRENALCYKLEGKLEPNGIM